MPDQCPQPLRRVGPPTSPHPAPPPPIPAPLVYAVSLQQNGKGSKGQNKAKMGRCGIACPTQAPAPTSGGAQHRAAPHTQEAADSAYLGMVAQRLRFKGWERHKPCLPVSPSRPVACTAGRTGPELALIESAPALARAIMTLSRSDLSSLDNDSSSATQNPLRWEAQVVTEIMARVAVAPVPVVAFKKLQ